ncbi:MAG TPA: tail fiber domain-containing protein [Thermoanaerobaculia bacterium]|nr:tail fiber domain-containing protein [Thermoanaerobaculia bacterium]
MKAILRTLIVAAMAAGMFPLQAQSAADIDVPLRDWVVPFSQQGAAQASRTKVQANALPTLPSTFVAIAPCRVLDTRNAAGPYGGPAIGQNGTRTFDLDNGPCAGIPANVAAYSINITVVAPAATGYLKAYPTGTVTFVSTMNYVAGQVIANAAIVPAGTNGAIDIYSGETTHVIVDMNGYFVENGGGLTPTLGGANHWTGTNTFANGISANNALITNVGNPVNAGDATNKAYVDANFVKFVPGAEQLSVGDANGTAPMINLRGGSTCCSGPGGHTPAWFKVFQNGSFVATGNLGIGTNPMQGKGYRTSWDSYKGAFRSGYADNEWDDATVGFFSWAGGSNSTAEGLYAFAFGDTNFARSTSSIAFGSGNEVKGAAGFSAGAGNRVCDTYGLAFGNKAQSGGPLINGKCDPDTFNIRGLAAVAIGYNVTADQDHTTAMGKFASNNGFSGTFIWSDGSAQQSADTFRNTANNEFAARATGGFRFRTNLGGTTGCNLPAGSGVFNCTSSRTTKENFAPVDGEQVLSVLRNLDITTWNYITEGKNVRHIGPMAEDFYSAFALGTGNASIGVQDLASVSLAAVKALEERTAQLQAKSAEVDVLRAQLAAMEERLAALEQKK